MQNKTKLSRRSFLKVLGVMAGQAFLLGVGSMTYATRLEPSWFEVTQLALKLPRLDKAFDGFRMAQISDIHMGSWITPERFGQVLELTLAQKPEMVVITGDFLYGLQWRPSVRAALTDLRAGLQQLANAVPTLAITGNHDLRTDPLGLRALLNECGILDLSNKVTTLQRGMAQLHFAGLDDYLEGNPNLKAVMAQLPEAGAAIALIHEPDVADEVARLYRFDLQLSGHSHGGQVNFPLVGPLILPALGQKYWSGVYKIDNLLLYTNRGIGSVLLVVRFNCRPEITVFTLQAEA